MGFEYDWLVIGDSDGAVYSASLAAHWGARVAWVLPQTSSWADRVTAEIAIAQLQQQPSRADMPTIWRLAQQQTENLAIFRSPATLALQGVDVLIGRADVEVNPHLSLRVKDICLSRQLRELRSRHYLLAPSPQPYRPPIQGLQETPHYHLSHLEPLLSKTLPQHLSIIGADPQGAVLAQTLARLGVSVQLLLAETNLLPREDPQLGQLLQAHLEAAGVQVLTETPVTQVRDIEGSLWLQGGHQALNTEAIVIADGWQGNLDEIGLDKTPVKCYPKKIRTSPTLQTAQERLYACGSVLGGYCDRELERYEAELATHNALMFSRHHVDYSPLPRIIATVPPIAAVGLTTPQARRQFGEEFVTLSLPLYQLESVQRRGNLSGFATLLVSPSGQILGAYSLGDEAPHWIQAIALLMKQKSHIWDLATLPPPNRDLFDAFMRLWRNVWRQHHPRWHSLQQAWFDWRRE